MKSGPEEERYIAAQDPRWFADLVIGSESA